MGARLPRESGFYAVARPLLANTTMEPRSRLHGLRATLLTALGLSPLVACGGLSKGEAESSGPVPGAGGSSSPAPSAGGAGGGPPGVDASASAPLLTCKNPVAVSVNGEATGFIRCEGQAVHRAAKQQCPTPVPRSVSCPTPVGCDAGAGCQLQCARDTDCTAQPNGYCRSMPSNFGPGGGNGGAPGCYCDYGGCLTDEDCAAKPGTVASEQWVCLCGEPFGQCVRARCSTDAECGEGLCVASYSSACGHLEFACQVPTDDCLSDDDCPENARHCWNGTCTPSRPCLVPGRPFLIEGIPRVASVSDRSDWRTSAAPNVEGLDASARKQLGEYWVRAALMEHASVAAFARFVLDLLALGAPPALVQAAQRAMQDETRHARDAFALASGYLGREVGPGALDLSGSFPNRDAREIIRAVILEGCIGETAAAAEAAEALAGSTDPAVRSVLRRIAQDEAAHAALAWRFLRWVIEHGDAQWSTWVRSELSAALRVESADELVPPARADDDASLEAHGLMKAHSRARSRRDAIRWVVWPCARVLIGNQTQRAAARHADALPDDRG